MKLGPELNEPVRVHRKGNLAKIDGLHVGAVQVSGFSGGFLIVRGSGKSYMIPMDTIQLVEFDMENVEGINAGRQK